MKKLYDDGPDEEFLDHIANLGHIPKASSGNSELLNGGHADIDVELAIQLSRKVHDLCRDVPHDIGIHLAIIIAEHQKV